MNQYNMSYEGEETSWKHSGDNENRQSYEWDGMPQTQAQDRGHMSLDLFIPMSLLDTRPAHRSTR